MTDHFDPAPIKREDGGTDYYKEETGNMNLLTSVRFFILLMLACLYGWFSWATGKFADIPMDVWVVGLICAGPQAVDLFIRIRDGLSGNQRSDSDG